MFSKIATGQAVSWPGKRRGLIKNLDRQPAVVLDVCDKDGEVRIRRRNGRQYTLRADDATPRQVAWHRKMAEHRARIQKIFPQRLTAKQTRQVDQQLAGE